MDDGKQNTGEQPSDDDKPSPAEQSFCGQLPGEDIDIEHVGSKPIDKEDPELIVRGWLSVWEILRKVFPPRRYEEDEDNA